MGNYPWFVAELLSMADLVDPVSEILKEKRPDIFVKAFESLAWSEVYLDRLNRQEFDYVYQITKQVFFGIIFKLSTKI